MLRKLHSNLIRHPSFYTFATYKINLGKLNTLEVQSEIELCPVFKNLCNELSQIDSYAEKPFLLMRKFESVLTDSNKLTNHDLDRFNYSMSLVGKA